MCSSRATDSRTVSLKAPPVSVGSTCRRGRQVKTDRYRYCYSDQENNTKGEAAEGTGYPIKPCNPWNRGSSAALVTTEALRTGTGGTQDGPATSGTLGTGRRPVTSEALRAGTANSGLSPFVLLSWSE